MTDQSDPPATDDSTQQGEAFRKLFNAKQQFGHTAVQACHATRTFNVGDVLGRVYTLEAMVDRLLEMFAEATGAPLHEVLQSVANHLDACTKSVTTQARSVQVATADVLRKR